ncbi:DUF4347 domain-containing protein [Leptolyngbya sp. AN02str]|uniref:DUF4347 domain-containing protein n=1 Tax=Leptolyngbya sp. AN02str TaxID=3423363 RepID=UPI003D310CAA
MSSPAQTSALSPAIAPTYPLSGVAQPGLPELAGKCSLSPSGNASSLLFIDSQVEDYQSLIASMTAGTQVFVLTPETNAIAQITQVLQGQSGISSLHIVSHGADGSLQLGDDWLTGTTLATHASQLQQWSRALTEQADILMYGCNVAATPQGASFVSRLSQFTGADVAASTDLTGPTALGHNWALEFTTGSIESVSPFSPGAIAAYRYTLNATVGVAALDSLAAEATGKSGVFRINRATDDVSQALTVNYTLGGTATNGTDYGSLAGSAVIAANKSFVDVMVKPKLDSVVEGNETVVMTLANGSYTIAPKHTTATVTMVDAPVVHLTVPDAVANEHIANSAKFCIHRTGGNLTQALTVKYTIAGTASNGTDYTALSGIATIAAGQTFTDVIINPINDGLSELGETIRITLTAGSYAIKDTAKIANLTIAGNDPTISLTAMSSTVVEGNTGTKALTYKVSLSHASDQAVTVNYATLDGTAKVGDGDYSKVAPTKLLFTPGMTQRTVSVLAKGDRKFESNETFYVQLASPVNGSLNPNAKKVAGRILNDDLMTAYNFGASSFRVKEGQQQNTVMIPLVRSGNVAMAGSVQVKLTGGTAIAGQHFLGNALTVAFAAGQTTAWLPLQLVGDLLKNVDRTLSLSIISFSHVGAFTNAPVVTVTLADDD